MEISGGLSTAGVGLLGVWGSAGVGLLGADVGAGTLAMTASGAGLGDGLLGSLAKMPGWGGDGAGEGMVMEPVFEVGLLRPWLFMAAGVLDMPFTCSKDSASDATG